MKLSGLPYLSGAKWKLPLYIDCRTTIALKKKKSGKDLGSTIARGGDKTRN